MFWFYFVRPVRRLLEGWQIKLPISVILAFAWDTVHGIIGVYGDLLALPPFLLGMATLAFFFDFLSAVLASYREHGIEGIQLIKFRQLLIKASYWAIVIGAGSNIASGAAQSDASWVGIFQNADAFVIFWLTLQDGWSTIQNWKGTAGAREWIRGAIDLTQGDLSLDQLDDGS